MTQLTPAPNSTILFEGDSLTGFRAKPCLDTWAWQRMSGAAYGYPERVGDWVFCHRPDLNLQLRLGAVAGSTIADVLARWPATAQLSPAIVVMTIGGNDAARNLAPETVAAHMGEFCHRLDQHCGGRVLYLGGLKPTLGMSEDTAARRLAAAEHFHHVAAAVSAHGGQVVDLGSVLASRAQSLHALWDGHTLYHDGTHFNNVGNEVVAGVVLEALGLMRRPGAPD